MTEVDIEHSLLPVKVKIGTLKPRDWFIGPDDELGFILHDQRGLGVMQCVFVKRVYIVPLAYDHMVMPVPKVEIKVQYA